MNRAESDAVQLRACLKRLKGMKVLAKNAPRVRANEGAFNEFNPVIDGGLPILKLVLETKAMNTAIRKKLHHLYLIATDSSGGG